MLRAIPYNLFSAHQRIAPQEAPSTASHLPPALIFICSLLFFLASPIFCCCLTNYGHIWPGSFFALCRPGHRSVVLRNWKWNWVVRLTSFWLASVSSGWPEWRNEWLTTSLNIHMAETRGGKYLVWGSVSGQYMKEIIENNEQNNDQASLTELLQVVTKKQTMRMEMSSKDLPRWRPFPMASQYT